MAGPWKYKRAAEFLLNTALGGARELAARLASDRDAAASGLAAARAELASLQARAAADSGALAGAKAEAARLAAQVGGKGGEGRAGAPVPAVAPPCCRVCHVDVRHRTVALGPARAHTRARPCTRPVIPTQQPTHPPTHLNAHKRAGV